MVVKLSCALKTQYMVTKGQFLRRQDRDLDFKTLRYFERKTGDFGPVFHVCKSQGITADA